MPFLSPRTREVRCPDGSTRFVYRNIEDVFPLGLKDAEKKMHAKMADKIGVMTAEMGGEHRATIRNVLFEIDAKNNWLMGKYRSAYAVFTANPCAAYNYLAGEFSRYNAMHDRFIMAEYKIDALCTLIGSPHSLDPQAISQLLTEIIEYMRIDPAPSDPSRVGQVIADHRDVSQDWTRKQPPAGGTDLPAADGRRPGTDGAAGA